MYPRRLEDWLQLIRHEFDDVRALRVTATEAGRRWPLDEPRLTGLLDALVHSGYLTRSADGVYARRRRLDG